MNKTTVEKFKKIHGWDEFWRTFSIKNQGQDNKEKLLEMVKNCEPRPTKSTPALLNALFSYTSPSSESYDVDFYREIREINPNWLINVEKLKKKKLLEMAKFGERRPIAKKNKLGYALNSYTNRRWGAYDAHFDKEIRGINPDWFTNTVSFNKMAKNVEKRQAKKDDKLGAL